MSNDPKEQLNRSPEQTLMVVRVLWGALLMGPVAFMVVVAVLISNGSMQPDPQTGQLVLYVSLGMLVLLVPTGYFIRGQMYKANWREDRVTPAGYLQGNLLLFAMMEGIAFTALVGCMLGGSLWPGVAPAALAMAVHVINFPTGTPMQSAQNPYTRRPDTD